MQWNKARVIQMTLAPGMIHLSAQGPTVHATTARNVFALRDTQAVIPLARSLHLAWAVQMAVPLVLKG